MKCNESVIIISAVRYMLGRGSYGVGCVVDYLRENKKRLTGSNSEVISRDIKEYFNEFKDAPYKDEWLKIAEEIINLK